LARALRKEDAPGAHHPERNTEGFGELLARRPVAFRIATQTLIGATALLAKSDRTLEQLVAEVAGEGGSTRAALEVLENGGLDSLLANGLKAAVARAQERNRESEAASWATPAST